MKKFDLTKEVRDKLLQHTIKRLESYYEHTENFKVLSNLNFEEIIETIQTVDFDQPIHPLKAIDKVIDGLENYTLHSTHPKCFGLFVPRPVFPGVIADLITAVINPQLSAWFHAAYAIEVERFLLRAFGEKFGYEKDQVDGVITSGGNEANLTGVLAALNHKYPKFSKSGLLGIDKQPVIYCSAEVHHSIIKAAKTTSLGYDAVKSIAVRSDLTMDVLQLRAAIEEDIKAGNQPLMIVGTAGTTGVGAIDDLVAIKEVANDFDLWFHVDAAYGGAVVFDPALKAEINGIQYADSITFDAHKWISMPMGISLFLTKHPTILRRTFDVNPEYLPKEKEEDLMPHPYSYSIQWSRRFMGLKLYLSLLIFGWEGFREMVRHQTKMGQYLKDQLIKNNWLLTNQTALPIVCFTDKQFQTDTQFAKTIAERIVASGKSWISSYPVQSILSLRACISNYRTTEKEVDELVQELNLERAHYKNNLIFRKS